MIQNNIQQIHGKQEALYDKIWNIYREYGVATALRVAFKLYGTSVLGLNVPLVNGEICELICSIELDDLKKRVEVKGRAMEWQHSIVLPDIHTKSDKFRTELDFIVYTPTTIFIVECKSYAGTNVMIGDGLLEGKHHSTDVYKQNRLHQDVLEIIAKPYTLTNKTPKFQLLCFLFSKNEIKDKRSAKAKKIMPIVTEHSFQQFIYENGFKGEPIWDLDNMGTLWNKLDEFTNKNRIKHLKYVTGGH